MTPPPTILSIFLSGWLQVAGALAEEGVGLEEIANRVNVVAKAMGECQPQGWEDVANMGTQSRLLSEKPFHVSLGVGGGSPGDTLEPGSRGYQSLDSVHQ